MEYLVMNTHSITGYPLQTTEKQVGKKFMPVLAAVEATT